ncbi:cation:proton antiporter subunit C [Myxococcota bacterium]|nr:cation:proton antiporter subunit C [Myxococcota bacterium]MBU1535838.1 cation:proton antiporter subunit C [Myxococcota bacterium]
MTHIALAGGALLILIGVWGMLTKKNIIRIIIGFSLFDTGLHVVLVGLGHLKNRTAPIIDSDLPREAAASRVVDPVPQAIVLTAIVIGLAVTAVLLAFALKLYQSRKTLDISELREGNND